jgi:hypothetical protein
VVDLHDPLLHPARDVHGPAGVAEVALELAEDRRHRVARERVAALHVVAVDRLDQAERRDLDQVVERLVAALVAAGELPGERHEAAAELVACAQVAEFVVEPEKSPVLGEPRVRRFLRGPLSGWSCHRWHLASVGGALLAYGCVPTLMLSSGATPSND